MQGKGEGQVQLRITYFPFELLYAKPRDASLVSCLTPPTYPETIYALILTPVHTGSYLTCLGWD